MLMFFYNCLWVEIFNRNILSLRIFLFKNKVTVVPFSQLKNYSRKLFKCWQRTQCAKTFNSFTNQLIYKFYENSNNEEGGWKNLKIHAKKREWKSNTASICGLASASCSKINIIKCCRQTTCSTPSINCLDIFKCCLKRRRTEYVPTISEKVSNQLKTQINSSETENKTLEKIIQRYFFNTYQSLIII